MLSDEKLTRTKELLATPGKPATPGRFGTFYEHKLTDQSPGSKKKQPQKR
jgi:hypothetical protein